MATIVSELDLEGFLSSAPTVEYPICPRFYERYKKAQEEGATEVIEANVKLNYGTYTLAKMSVKPKSPEYGRNAGYITWPGCLERRIVQKIKEEWVLARISTPGELW